MQTILRLATPRVVAGLCLGFAALVMSGCGGSSGFGSPADDDLGDLAVLFFNSEDVAGVFRDSRLEISFNGPLAVDSVNSGTINIFLDGDQDATSAPPCNPADGDQPNEWVPGQFFVGLNQVTFVPDNFFAPNTVYCVIINSQLEDAQDRQLGGDGFPLIRNVQEKALFAQYRAFFITGAGFTFSNEVTDVTPGAAGSPGTGGVDITTCIDITHSRPIDPATVDGGSVQIVDMSTCTAVPGAFTFPTQEVIRFCPTLPLTEAAIHRVTVTSAVEDLEGIGSNGGEFFFTTEFPAPDGTTTFMELFDDATLEETDPAELPPMIDRADWAGTSMTPAGLPGRLAATVGPELPVGGSGTLDLQVVTGGGHDINTDTGEIDGVPAPVDGVIPSFLGDGVFQFRNIEIAGIATVEAIGSWPLQLMASGTIDVFGDIDVRGEDGGSAIAGSSEPGGLVSSIQRAGGTVGGTGAPSNGTAGLNGADANSNLVPFPVMVGQGGGCGGDAFIDPVGGDIGAGGGGGGFHEPGWNSQTVISGVFTYNMGLGTAGQCDPNYGGLPVQQNRRLTPLFGGGGGGGGASHPDSPGGGGGTGSGSIGMFCAGLITIEGSIFAFGGAGGNVNSSSMLMPDISGGGGGGAGGGLYMGSATFVDASLGLIDVSGGLGGTVPPPTFVGIGNAGGHGAVGLIVAEGPPIPQMMGPPLPGVALGMIQPQFSPPLPLTPLNLGAMGLGACTAFAPGQQFPNAVQVVNYCDQNIIPATTFFQANVSVGQSVWLRLTDNGIPVGAAGAGAPVRNCDFASASFLTTNVPAGGTAVLEWQGAEEDTPGSGTPKAETITPWTTNVDLLDTHELIRFRATLTNVTLPNMGVAPPAAAILDLSINYSFNN